jgi:predicted Rossmann fold nucleotide-binding protein DprA/Smf involved in DNA uptake
MAIVLEVNWIDQSEHSDPHQCLRHIGGMAKEFQWKHSHTQAIQFIERRLFHYYVEKDGRALKLEVARTANGCKFLKTAADGEYPALLLNLPKFPTPATAVQDSV